MATIPFELDMTGFDSPESLEGGGRTEPGTYHLVVCGPPRNDVLNSKSELLDCLRVTFQVIDGTTPGQDRSRFHDDFWMPNPNHKDGGEFAKRKLTFLGLATGLIARDELGRPKRIDWAELDGCQLVAKVKHRRWKDKDGNDGATAEIDGLSIYHPLDPRVASVPKDMDLIREAELVWTGASAPPQKNGQDDGGATPVAKKAKPAASPAKSANDPFAGL